MTDEPTIETAPDADRSPAGELPGVGALVPQKAPEMPERSFPFGKPEGASGTPGNLPNYQQDWQSGDVGSGLSPKPDKWDKLAGGLSEGMHNSFMGTLLKTYQEKSAETGQMLPADQANKMNPYRTTPYTTPVDSGIVSLEMADGRRKQQMQEWLGRNTGGGFARGAGNFAGALVDAPLYMAVGALTGGLGDLVPAGLGAGGRLAAHYGLALAEFTGVGNVQNTLDTDMGEKKKSLSELVQENLGGAALATGLGYAARHFMDSGASTPEAVERGIKENAAALGNDEKIPSMAKQRETLQERASGVTQPDPNGEKIQPTVKTSPLLETPLYGATHGDGSPLLHDHGLGPGVQVTDSIDKANNGVSRSSDIPGQIHQTKLPADTKLLDIDKSAAGDYEAKDSLLKAIEEKTGIPLDGDIKNGESLKDVINKLGDWAGAEIGSGKTIPEDILKQVQEIAKDQGYDGYQFQQDNARTAHLFDPNEAGLEISGVQQADPSKTAEIPPAIDTQPTTPEAQEAADKVNSQNYSPSVQAALDDIRKTAMTLHPDNLAEQITEAQKTLTEHKQLLSQMAKENPEAEAAMTELREQEVHDKRMLDLAKRIMNCGGSQ